MRRVTCLCQQHWQGCRSLISDRKHALSEGLISSQVDDDAAPEVIKVAYRALAKACHPDFLGAKGEPSTH
jgi:hypothetical protein